MRLSPGRLVGLFTLAAVLAVTGACGGNAEAGVRLVPVATAAEVLADQPDNLVVLDVRTPEEFNESRLEGATMIDFHEADFVSRISELDRDASYLLYCRSGNRSASTAAVMEGLGFTDVIELDGGINAWTAAGQSVVN